MSDLVRSQIVGFSHAQAHMHFMMTYQHAGGFVGTRGGGSGIVQNYFSVFYMFITKKAALAKT